MNESPCKKSLEELKNEALAELSNVITTFKVRHRRKSGNY